MRTGGSTCARHLICSELSWGGEGGLGSVHGRTMQNLPASSRGLGEQDFFSLFSFRVGEKKKSQNQEKKRSISKNGM